MSTWPAPDPAPFHLGLTAPGHLAHSALSESSGLGISLPDGSNLSEGWLLVGLAGSAVLVGCGYGIRRLTRPLRPGRHRANRRDRSRDTRPDVDRTPGRHAARDTDDPTTSGTALDPGALDDWDTELPRDVPENVELTISPLSGTEVLAHDDVTGIEDELAELAAGLQDRDDLAKGRGVSASGSGPSAGVPARRATTSGGARSATFDTDPAAPSASVSGLNVSSQVVPTLPPTADLDPLEIANRMATAWANSDADELAALASSNPAAALAGNVLAAAAAARLGDTRSISYLQAAFVDGRDPLDEPLLGPYRDQITFHVSAPDLGISDALPCSRTGIGCALACAERSVSDAESAYSVLLELPDDAVVVALRAAAALDLDWPGRALRTLAADVDADRAGPYEPVLLTLKALAVAATGGDPVSAFTEALEAIDSPVGMTEPAATVPGSPENSPADPRALVVEPQLDMTLLRERVLFERGRARASAGDVAGAWDDLAEVLEHNPNHADAAQALKHL